MYLYLAGLNMNLLKFGWLKNGFAQIWLAQKWVCSNLAGSKMGLFIFVLAQILARSNVLLKYGV